MYLYLRSYKINSISSSLTSSKRQKKKRRKKITTLIIRSFLDISTIIPSGAFLFNVIPTDTDKPVRSTFPCVPFPAVLQQPPLYETSIIYGGSVRGVREIVRNIPLSPDEELVCDRIGGVTRGREGRRGEGDRSKLHVYGRERNTRVEWHFEWVTQHPDECVATLSPRHFKNRSILHSLRERGIDRGRGCHRYRRGQRGAAEPAQKRAQESACPGRALMSPSIRHARGYIHTLLYSLLTTPR